MLHAIWISLLGLFGHQNWADPEASPDSDSGHGMDPNG